MGLMGFMGFMGNFFAILFGGLGIFCIFAQNWDDRQALEEWQPGNWDLSAAFGALFVYGSSYWIQEAFMKPSSISFPVVCFCDIEINFLSVPIDSTIVIETLNLILSWFAQACFCDESASFFRYVGMTWYRDNENFFFDFFGGLEFFVSLQHGEASRMILVSFGCGFRVAAVLFYTSYIFISFSPLITQYTCFTIFSVSVPSFSRWYLKKFNERCIFFSSNKVGSSK